MDTIIISHKVTAVLRKRGNLLRHEVNCLILRSLVWVMVSAFYETLIHLKQGFEGIARRYHKTPREYFFMGEVLALHFPLCSVIYIFWCNLSKFHFI